MDTTTLLFITVIVCFVALIYFVNRKLTQLKEDQKPNDELLEVIKLMQEGSKDDRKVLLDSLQKNTQALNQRLDNAAKVIGDVNKNIGEMSEIGRSMKDLQEFLKSPKLRGNIGEQILTELLGQMLPKQSFHIQYTFKTGDKVDAAIKTSAGLVSVDSKFPMENYRKMVTEENTTEKKKINREFEKDVKKHINDISRKYILTEEGTIDYALMYIPSESVYYEIVNNLALFEYSNSKRVLPVSPTTFYAYLRAILMSFEGQKIETKAKEILAAIRAIQKDYNKVEDNLTVLQKHLNNAYNMMGNVVVSFSRLGQKITNTKSIGQGVEEEESRKKLSED